MGIAEALQKAAPRIPTLLYCDRGGSGADGAGLFCCSTAFFRLSRMPPLVGGATGVAPPLTGADCEAGWPTIELGLRS